MKCKTGLALIMAGCMAAAAAGLRAQEQNSRAEKNSQTPQNNSAQQPPAPQTDANGNPFPEDVTAVPLMPSSSEPDAADTWVDASNPDAAPATDSDPVRSPEELAPVDNGASEGFSSSRNGLDNLVPEPDTEPADKKGRKNSATLDMIPQESPEKDVEVGNYYMDNKNWKGALSRFQSALVLAPDNPDVYWGLAECERHLGQFAEARANYVKVVEYDPDSKHGKDAKKTLKTPEIENAGKAQK